MQRADIAWEVEKCRGKADVGVRSWEACCSCFLSWESSGIVHMMIERVGIDGAIVVIENRKDACVSQKTGMVVCQK